uniref:Phospholipid scramblase n=1 Tax=Plectus sambesii TaxID=2011161 RepID=A0A914W464_9BILA
MLITFLTSITIFQVHSDGAQSYRVQRAASAVGGALPPYILRIEKEFGWIYSPVKMMSVIGSSCVYRFKDCDGRVLGYVRPKLVMRKNTLILKFMPDRGSAQVRGAMLGAALLFVLHEAYPEVGNLLQEGMQSS